MENLQTREFDQRITEELENLNNAADEINSMEVLLGEARGKFRQALSDATRKLNELGNKLGSCVERSRPYYNARIHAKQLQQETQAAAVRFERANSQLATAKEMVDLAEQEVMKDGQVFDTNWQEMLNQATMKVNEAEKERIDSEAEHLATSSRFEAAEKEVKRLQRSQKRNINKSRPYFENKNELNLLLEALKSKVDVLEQNVKCAKEKYKAALSNLEMISSSIHQQRRSPLEKRGSGVGAESTESSPEAPLSPTHITFSEYPLSDPTNAVFCALDKEYEGHTLLLRARRVSSMISSSSLDEDSQGTPSDPLSIMGQFASTEHLDNLSDTASFVSSDAISDQEGIERDSIFSDEGLDSHCLKCNQTLDVEGAVGFNFPEGMDTESQEITLVLPKEEDTTITPREEEETARLGDGETVTARLEDSKSASASLGDGESLTTRLEDSDTPACRQGDGETAAARLGDGEIAGAVQEGAETMTPAFNDSDEETYV